MLRSHRYFIITSVSANEQEIGASLNKKVELNVAELPKQVTDAINQARPGFVVKEAEKEYKHGNVYIDVEGLDKDGNEVEFDSLKQGEYWKIVEIQRDLTLKQTPEIVAAALKSEQPNIQPKRIIESEQVNSEHINRVVIYEFYVINQSSGDEQKFEVKLSEGKAKLLKKEWQH